MFTKKPDRLLCIGLLSIGIVIFTWLFLPTLQLVLAATCSGSGCNGTDPGTTGCSVNSSTVRYKTFSDNAQVLLKYSNICYTYWAKTYNKNTVNKWTKAVLKELYQYTAYVAPNLSVYTNQQYNKPYPSYVWTACGLCRDYQPGPGEIGNCVSQ